MNLLASISTNGLLSVIVVTGSGFVVAVADEKNLLMLTD
jgi:hypothetical protein